MLRCHQCEDAKRFILGRSVLTSALLTSIKKVPKKYHNRNNIHCNHTIRSSLTETSAHSLYLLQNTATMSINYVPPNQARHLRACMVCAIVQTQNVSSPHSLSRLRSTQLTTSPALPQGRMSKLRAIPSPRRLNRRYYRLHITSIRRTHHTRRSGEKLGRQMESAGWVC